MFLFIYIVLLLFIGFSVFHNFYYCDRRHSRRNRANNKREYLRLPLSIHVYGTCVVCADHFVRWRRQLFRTRWPVRDGHNDIHIGTTTTTKCNNVILIESRLLQNSRV